VTYIDFIYPLVYSQCQVGSICFDFSSAYVYVPHSVSLYKICVCGLSDRYVNWFCSYLTDCYSSVRISGAFSSLFTLSSSVRLGSVLGPLLLNTFVNGICNVIRYCR
jgi:hypothetical protein